MLHCEASQHDGQPGLKLAGDLTIYTVAEAKAAILAAMDEHASLELNLSEIEELDTAGVQLLVWLKRTAAGHGTTLSLTHHSAVVVEVLDLLKVAGTLGDPILIGP